MIDFYDLFDRIIEKRLNMRPERDLEQDLLHCDWILVKCKDDCYAQNLYSAICNMQWLPLDVMAILKDQLWSASWRAAGRIVADLRNQAFMQADGVSQIESYMDWYCSGLVSDGSGQRTGYVSEGTVTDQIREDLLKLGWVPVPYEIEVV